MENDEQTLSLLLRRSSEQMKKRDAERPQSGGLNIFSVLGIERSEVLTHSKVIFSLLNPFGQHQAGDRYLQLFLEEIQIPQEFRAQRWQIEREWPFENGRIDFWLNSPKMCIAIEMKIDASDQPQQLSRYADYAKAVHSNYLICYLTLDGKAPSFQSVQGVPAERLCTVSFDRHVINWLEQCLVAVLEENLMSSFLRQYLDLVKKIVGEEKMSTNILDLIVDAQTLKGAIAIANELDTVKTNILISFMDMLRKNFRSKGCPVTFYNPALIETYYTGSAKTSPCLCFEVMKVGTNQATGNAIVLCLSVEIDWNMFCWLGFTEVCEEGWVSTPPTKVEELISTTYQKVSEAAQTVYGDSLKQDGNAVHWHYLHSSDGELYDFKHFSDNCIRLKDAAVEELETNRISDMVIGTLKALQHLLH